MKLATSTAATALLSAILLSGCENTTQTTTGTDYLSNYPAAAPLAQNPQSGESAIIHIDQEVREAASIEPNLRFPARIGLARISKGRLTNFPSEESVAWNEAKDRLGSAFGAFVPISPLIAEMATPQPRDNRGTPTQAILRKIRLAAARQHLDAILIYEVYSNSQSKSMASEVANWTIIGAYIVPSQQTKTVGFSNALLVDVRNGYPYGTATATAEKKHVAASFNARDKRRKAEAANEIASNLNLIPEVEKMFQTLRQNLPPK